MDADVTSHLVLSSQRSDNPLTQICRTALVVAVTLATVLSLLTFFRAALGELQAPSTTFGRFIPVVVATLLATLFRVALKQTFPDTPRIQRLMLQMALPSVCIASICAAISLSGSGIATAASIWLIALVSEVAWWRSTIETLENSPSSQHDSSIDRIGQFDAVGVAEEQEDELDASILQQFTRSKNADNVEVVSGVLRAEFTANNRARNLHVAFCPPLEYEPSIVVHQLDGAPTTIKVAQAEVFGARIELRLQSTSQTTETVTICIEVEPKVHT